MSGALHVSAVGLREQQRALTVIANNVANVNTPAFKRDDIRFSEIVLERGGVSTDPRAVNDGGRQMSGVEMRSMPMLMEQGALRQTGETLDIAIEGAGFIELMGPAGQTLLWRGGRLRVMSDGSLANAQGLVLKSAIVVPTDATALTINRDGTVTAIVSDQVDPVELGQIELVRLTSEVDAERLNGGVFRMIEGADNLAGVAGEDAFGSFVQGSIEQSSVTFDDEMVQLLLIQRAFAANAQIVQAADQLLGIANNLKR